GVVRGQRVHQPADARPMYFDAEVIARGVVFARPRERLAVAEADFEHARRAVSEHGIEVAPLAGVVDAEAGPVFRERALLRRGDAALSQDEAADGAVALERFVIQE